MEVMGGRTIQLILADIGLVICIVSLVVILYLGAGLILPDLNLGIEQKIRRYFRIKSAVIVVNPNSYIRKRNWDVLLWVVSIFMVSVGVITLIICAL